jgi:hypothetical protein
VQVVHSRVIERLEDGERLREPELLRSGGSETDLGRTSEIWLQIEPVQQGSKQRLCQCRLSNTTVSLSES